MPPPTSIIPVNVVKVNTLSLSEQRGLKPSGVGNRAPLSFPLFPFLSFLDTLEGLRFKERKAQPIRDIVFTSHTGPALCFHTRNMSTYLKWPTI